MHKILLVEDDQVIRQQVGKLLSEWGFEVVLVEDFMEVLSLFRVFLKVVNRRCVRSWSARVS